MHSIMQEKEKNCKSSFFHLVMRDGGNFEGDRVGSIYGPLSNAFVLYVSGAFLLVCTEAQALKTCARSD